jgi:hypothetical protein
MFRQSGRARAEVKDAYNNLIDPLTAARGRFGQNVTSYGRYAAVALAG